MARPVSARQVVVGAAIIERGRLLAAQRDGPPALAGRWELPGGKVDPGEGDAQALRRECREELAVTVRLGRRIGGDWPLPENAVLRVWLAEIIDGRPRPLAHRALRWLTLDRLYEVAWLPADLPVIAAIRPHLDDGRTSSA